VLLTRLVGWVADSIADAMERRARAAGPLVPSFIARGGRVLIDGVTVRIAVVSDPIGYVEIRASARGAPRILRQHSWHGPARPDAATALDDLPVLAADTRGDDAAALALPALSATWDRARADAHHIVLTSDGADIVAWLDHPETQEQIDATIAAVVALARWQRDS
jgi:hypothetical protein